MRIIVREIRPDLRRFEREAHLHVRRREHTAAEPARFLQRGIHKRQVSRDVGVEVAFANLPGDALCDRSQEERHRCFLDTAEDQRQDH